MSELTNSIPVIDLFAGPGGLGEGFMSLKNQKGTSIFDIKLSIEKDENAHKTLCLRSFYRQFVKNNKQVPEDYYDALREPNLRKREALIEEMLNRYDEGAIARKEARLIELGAKNWPAKVVDGLIKEQLNKSKDWVLIGGPPCQAYSLAGRSRVGGINEDDHRVFLYKEYLRIIARHSPPVFVMENVKGLLSAKVNNEKVFDWILRDLRNPSSVFSKGKKHKYKIFSLSTYAANFDKIGNPIYKEDKDFLINSEKYGVPQKRHRVILLGIRDDIKVNPTILSQVDELMLKDIIGDLPKLRSGIGRSIVSSEIIGGRKKRVYRKEDNSNQNWETQINSFKELIRSKNGFPELFSTDQVLAPKHGFGSEFVKCKTPSDTNPRKEWYSDVRLKGVCNHESRTHLLEDLKRYMFSAMYAKTNNEFPRMHHYEKYVPELLPDHESAKTGKFADRFRVQMPDKAATTVTSHISKDGHYFIHYDYKQCRSLTVREAARIQTFPDNYLFCGSRTAQYHQVGNAVPPYLAYQIAIVVEDVFHQLEKNKNYRHTSHHQIVENE